MKHRMAVAALALVGFFIALYLWLWHTGVIGELVCGDAGCETVQLSEYARLFGVPVSLVGMAGYVALFTVSMVGLTDRWLDRREPTVLLVALASIGVAYSAYLTYLEAAVIHAWCRYCVASAVVMVLVFAASLLGLREVRATPAQPSGRV
jgi:uncharacterized membrane protein